MSVDRFHSCLMMSCTHIDGNTFAINHIQTSHASVSQIQSSFSNTRLTFVTVYLQGHTCLLQEQHKLLLAFIVICQTKIDSEMSQTQPRYLPH